MRRVLEDEQYQVSILQDGNDAFTTMKATLPDLLILDLKLGNISGKDIFRQLKDDTLTAEIPVIVYTAAVLEAEEVSKLIASDPDYYQGVRLIIVGIARDELADFFGLKHCCRVDNDRYFGGEGIVLQLPKYVFAGDIP